MSVKRIVLDIAADSVADVHKVYSVLFGLEKIMVQGWIVTLAAEYSARVKVIIASEGSSSQRLL